MRIAAEFLSARNMAKVISEVSGKKVNLQEVLTEPVSPSENNSALDDLQTKCVSVYFSSRRLG
jgi:hypothetical protein